MLKFILKMSSQRACKTLAAYNVLAAYSWKICMRLADLNNYICILLAALIENICIQLAKLIFC
jgi:hypothetical protein